MSGSARNAPIGWVVEVTLPDGVTRMFYAAGFFMTAEAEGAVRMQRGSPAGEAYRAVDPITAAHGPTVTHGEVRELSESV